jgi:hypothetical protein
MKYIFRFIALPFVFGLNFLANLRMVFKNCWYFILYGGEFVHFMNKDTQVTLAEILKKVSDDKQG